MLFIVGELLASVKAFIYSDCTCYRDQLNIKTSALKIHCASQISLSHPRLLHIKDPDVSVANQHKCISLQHTIVCHSACRLRTVWLASLISTQHGKTLKLQVLFTGLSKSAIKWKCSRSALASVAAELWMSGLSRVYLGRQNHLLLNQ